MSDEDGFFEHPAERFFLSQTYRLVKFRLSIYSFSASC